MLFNAIYWTNMLISILFLEAEYPRFGLGVDKNSISYVSFICFIPSIILIFISPFIVNKYISDKSFIVLIISIYMMATLLVPFLKDLKSEFNLKSTNIFALINLGITNCTSPGLISPYFYYYVIRKTPMKYRTNVNSSIFLATQLFNSILVLFGGFLYSLCMHNEYL